MWLLWAALMAGAPADHVELSWEAPSPCPLPTDVLAEVDRLLAGGNAAGKVRASVTVSERGETWSAQFSMESDGGRTDKTFVAERCETVGDAVALEVALVLDLDRALETLARDEQPASAPAREPVVPPAVPAPQPPATEVAVARQSAARPRQPPVHAGVRATAGVALGQTASATGGFGVAASAVLHNVRVEATGWVLLPSPQPVADSDGEVDVLLGSAGLRACPIPRLGPVEMPLCVGFEGGALRAEAKGLPRSSVAVEPWAAFAVAPAIATKLFSNVHLWVEGAAVLNIVRPGFHVGGAGRVYRMPMGTARVVAGVEMRFGGAK